MYPNLKKWSLALALTWLICPALLAQDDTTKPDETVAEESKPETYEFTIEANLPCTDVESQDRTGTCWCFATASFMESELIRQGHGEHELSEMFIVKNVYRDKARNYLLRQGKANFGEGALAHDFINAAGRHGLVPDAAYSGLINGGQQHDHSEMAAVLEGMLTALTGRRRLGTTWDDAYSAVLDAYLGASPEEFSYQGQSFTPRTFAEHVGFNADDYVNLTSYTHHPFHRPFVLEIPDNYSNGSFHNVPIDRLVEVIDSALDSGFTVAWDGDVSEKAFSAGQGLAILPTPDRRDALKVPGDEIEVTQEMRQNTFEELSTTDDHLMHLVGRARDQQGTKYYIIKNSWGDGTGPYKGYIYMSEAYVRLKTVAILVHKDVVTQEAAMDDTVRPTETSSR